MSADVKRCPICGKTKQASEFYGHPHTSDCLSTYCKECDSAIHRAKYRKRCMAATGKIVEVERYTHKDLIVIGEMRTQAARAATRRKEVER